MPKESEKKPGKMFSQGGKKPLLKRVKKYLFNKERLFKIFIVVSSVALLASSVLPYMM